MAGTELYRFGGACEVLSFCCGGGSIQTVSERIDAVCRQLTQGIEHLSYLAFFFVRYIAKLIEKSRYFALLAQVFYPQSFYFFQGLCLKVLCQCLQLLYLLSHFLSMVRYNFF